MICMDRSIHRGDCLEVLPTMADDSFDSCVTDPPYGLKFMGKSWDHGVPGVEYWGQVMRVLKPGAHLLAFGGTRTFHRLACAIEDAGFEIRDCIMWVYGSGFPKSLDVSKAIDKSGGQPWGNFASLLDAARQWNGWGTAMKPSWEPIIVARKPLIGTVAQNVLQHGTGGINIDACRIGTADDLNGGRYSDNKQGDDGNSYGSGFNRRSELDYTQPPGRWPANLIHDGSEEVVELFPRNNPSCKSPSASTPESKFRPSGVSAARFFYCAKASKSDRGPDNKHPTVKPTALMRYLCRVVTPPGGVILDPFMGSGSTGVAAYLELFSFVGIELHESHCEIAARRMSEAVK